MIVADASLLVNFYVGDQAMAAAVLKRDAEWYTTPLWRSETHNALLKYIRAKRLSVADAESVIVKATALTDGRVRNTSTARILAAATSHELSGYDAEYVALAKETGFPLVTFDRRLTLAARGIAFLPADFLARP